MTPTPDGLSPTPEADPLDDHPLRAQILHVQQLRRTCCRHLEDLDKHGAPDEAQEWLSEWAQAGAYGYALWWMWRSDTAADATAALTDHRDATAATERGSDHQAAWIEALDQVLDVLRPAGQVTS